MKKLENHWFKHDMNASQDTKLQKLEFKYPLVGYAIFFKLVEVLMQNNGSVENNLEVLAHQLRISDLEVLRAVLNDFDLFVVDDAIITSDRVLKQLSEITEKFGKASESAYKMHAGNYEKALSELGLKIFIEEEENGLYKIYHQKNAEEKQRMDYSTFENLEHAEKARYEHLKEQVNILRDKGQL